MRALRRYWDVDFRVFCLAAPPGGQVQIIITTSNSAIGTSMPISVVHGLSSIHGRCRAHGAQRVRLSRRPVSNIQRLVQLAAVRANENARSTLTHTWSRQALAPPSRHTARAGWPQQKGAAGPLRRPFFEAAHSQFCQASVSSS